MAWTDGLRGLVNLELGGSIFGAKNYVLVYFPYLVNRLEFSALMLINILESYVNMDNSTLLVIFLHS